MADATDLQGDNPSGGMVSGDAVAAEVVQEPPPTITAEYVPERIGPGFWAALGWTVLLVIALNFAMIFVAALIMIAGGNVEKSLGILFLASSLTTTMCALALSFAFYQQAMRRKLAITRPLLRHVAVTLLLVGPLGVVVQEIAAWAGEVLPSIEDMGYEELAQSPWLLVMVAGCVLPGVGEELFFRGYLGRGLLARLGLWWGMLWTSVLFAIVHINPPQVVGIVFIGLALHAVLLASRSLLIPMLLHFLNNLASFGFARAEMYSLVDHLPLALVGAGLLGLVPVAILFWQSCARWVLPDGNEWTPGFVSAEAPPHVLGAQLVGGCSSAFVWAIALATQALFWTLLFRLA